MINPATWPHDQDPHEQQLLCNALAQCETPAQQERVLGAFLLGDLLMEILLAPPVWREHWWQFWHLRRDQR